MPVLVPTAVGASVPDGVPAVAAALASICWTATSGFTSRLRLSFTTDFQCNLARVRDLAAIYTTFSKRATSALDLSDLLRAELVLAVSAFDHFIGVLANSGDIPNTDLLSRLWH